MLSCCPKKSVFTFERPNPSALAAFFSEAPFVLYAGATAVSEAFWPSACWALLVTLISTAVPQAVADFCNAGKSIEATLLLVITSTCSLDLFKYALNQSRMLKKDFEISRAFLGVRFFAVGVVALFAWSMMHDISTTGYNAVIFLAALVATGLQEWHMLGQRKLAYIREGTANDSSILNNQSNSAASEENILPSSPSPSLCNALALHSARFVLLGCGTYAGGELLAYLGITPGPWLERTGLNKLFPLVVFSTLLNELLGSLFFYGADLFKQPPNFIMQIIELVLAAAVLQSLVPDSLRITDNAMLDFFIAYITGFAFNLLLEASGCNARGEKYLQAKGAMAYQRVNFWCTRDYTAVSSTADDANDPADVNNFDAEASRNDFLKNPLLPPKTIGT